MNRYPSHVAALIETRPDWLEFLVEEYKISANRAGDLVSLKYDQIESPMHEPIVQECRGMVVDLSRDKILAHPYNKFWNYGDVPAAEIDWNTAKVFEKLDGSLMILFWNDATGAWQVASSGTPDAGGSYGRDSDRTFADAFWETFDDLGMEYPQRQDLCYMFEYCAPDNRIVVRYEEPTIVLHGARNMETGQELAHRELQGLGENHRWRVVQAFDVNSSSAAVVALATELDPLSTEGFVVVDAAFNRVKVKSPRYVVLHHMKGAATIRRAIELWQTGDAGELLSYFPEMRDVVDPVHAALDFASYAALLDYAKNRELPSRKDYALAVKDKPWSATAFKLYQEGTKTLEASKAITRGLSVSALERLVEQVTP